MIKGHQHTNGSFVESRKQLAPMQDATHLNLRNNEPLKLLKGVWYHSYKQVWQAALIQSSKWVLLDKGVIVPIVDVCYNPSRYTNLKKLNKS